MFGKYVRWFCFPNHVIPPVKYLMVFCEHIKTVIYQIIQTNSCLGKTSSAHEKIIFQPSDTQFLGTKQFAIANDAGEVDS